MRSYNIFYQAAKAAQEVAGNNKFVTWRKQTLIVFPITLSNSDAELGMLRELLSLSPSKQGTIHVCFEINTLALVTSANSLLFKNFANKANYGKCFTPWSWHKIHYKEGQEIVNFKVSYSEGEIKIMSAYKQTVVDNSIRKDGN